MKVIFKSQSKNTKFGECYNCLFGGKNKQECEKYILRSVSHEMYLQLVQKSTSSNFDDKRCYINETESKPWQ